MFTSTGIYFCVVNNLFINQKEMFTKENRVKNSLALLNAIFGVSFK